VAELTTLLTHRGLAALPQLRAHWLAQTPARASEWQSLDLTGDGRDELLLLWYGGPQQPQLAQVAVLAEVEAGRPALLFDQRLSTRQETVTQLAILATADLTGDAQPDAVLHDETTGQLFVVTAASGRLELLAVPERCQGSLGIFDHDGDGLVEIIRDGCDQSRGRVIYAWTGRDFAAIESNLPH
jgi:hypothetical protein